MLDCRIASKLCISSGTIIRDVSRFLILLPIFNLLDGRVDRDITSRSCTPYYYNSYNKLCERRLAPLVFAHWRWYHKAYVEYPQKLEQVSWHSNTCLWNFPIPFQTSIILWEPLLRGGKACQAFAQERTINQNSFRYGESYRAIYTDRASSTVCLLSPILTVQFYCLSNQQNRLRNIYVYVHIFLK